MEHPRHKNTRSAITTKLERSKRTGTGGALVFGLLDTHKLSMGLLPDGETYCHVLSPK
jgi:hypothetical protein